MLTSLQTAAGYFKEDAIIEILIGEKFLIFQKQCVAENIETSVWVTALVISYIEMKFQNEKDSWAMIVEKARNWLQKADLIIRASECLAG